MSLPWREESTYRAVPYTETVGGLLGDPWYNSISVSSGSNRGRSVLFARVRNFFCFTGWRIQVHYYALGTQGRKKFR